MSSSFSIQRNFSLRTLNSFNIDVNANFYGQVRSVDDLRLLSEDTELSRLPRLILGGGSNIVLTRDFPGLVLQMAIQGKELIDEDEHVSYVSVGAGENWHDFVLWTLAQGMGGLENLSLIPGTVGAAPVQNIGAYGTELQDYFHSLLAFDFETGTIKTYTKSDCQFAYRDSIFKRELSGRVVILEVRFALPKQWKPDLSYAEVQKEVNARGLLAPSALDISNMIVAIRQKKLPDPAQIGNAGSFFKNPVISTEQLNALRQGYPQMPAYVQADGHYRIAAGWLIDQCGWKGKQLGNAGVYETQALVLVNRGGVSGNEVIALAQAIQADVESKYGLKLEMEPVIV